MTTIRLKNNISFEQYQMAVRVLEAINIEVDDENVERERTFELSDWQEEMILERAKIISVKNSKKLEDAHKIIEECFK